MVENPFARFAEKPVEAPAADNPFTQFAEKPGDRLQGLWDEVQAGRRRFSSMTEADQDAVVRRFSPSNAGNAGAQGMLMNWADEATAGANALAETVGLGRRYAGGNLTERYQDHKAFQDAQQRTYAADNPKTDFAARAVGGLAGAVALPASTLMRGASTGAAVGNGMMTGLAYGALAGAGEGNSLDERGWNAARGAGVGLGVGIAAPFAARGISNAYGYVADRTFRAPPAALRGYERGAVERVGRAMGDDGVTPQVAATARARLGPEGMLADLGDNLRGQAGGIAATPGAGKSIVYDALRARADGAPARITRDVDAAFGPARSLPDTLEGIRQTYAQRSGQLYDQFRQTPVPFTREIEATFDALRSTSAGQRAIRDAHQNWLIDQAARRSTSPRQFFANIADDGSMAVQRVPNAAEWDYLKRALDGHASAAQRSGERNAESQFSALSRRVRDTVDEAISPGDAANSVYARARATSAEGFGLRDAIEEGRTAFSRGITPDQMRVDMAARTQPERMGYALGARDNVRQMMGNAATKWGDNPDTAARSALGSQNAREKLDIIAPRSADGLSRRLDAETAFDRTVQAATGNSVTTARANAAAEFPGATRGPFNQGNIGQTTATGLLMRGGTAAINALTGGALTERNARIAADAARLLTRQGGDSDMVISALLQRAQSRGTTAAERAQIERLARVLMESPRPALVDMVAH
ncbi:MAG: hypothetical protein LCH88_09180 [Proteobacteria bacterium]|nr:hypothetical protein [Pseudomonadota bacterium]